MNAKAYHSQWG